MGKSLGFYDRFQIGTSLVGMPESVTRLGAGRVVGLDRDRADVDFRNPNFAMTVTVLAPFHNSSWRQRDLHAQFRTLHDGLIELARLYGYGWLVWINDTEQTSPTVNLETVGTAVSVEVQDLSDLALSVNDYVMFIPPTNATPVQVKKVTDLWDPTESLTVENLDYDLPIGTTVYKVFVAYPRAIFVASDIGQPAEQSQDTYRFSTTWQFEIGGVPVRSPSA